MDNLQNLQNTLKELKELVKIEKKLQNPCLTNSNILKLQDLWKPHYQTLPSILLNELIKLNAKRLMQRI